MPDRAREATPRIKLIFNAASDRGRSGQKASDLRAIVEQLGGADWAGTEYPGHGAELAFEAAEAGYEIVVALGGDGTAHEVVNGLMRVPRERRPQMGLVPIGSGNDLAYASGIALDNPQEAMARAFQGTPRPLDVGRITDGSGRSRYWCNSAGFLFDAAVLIQSRGIRHVHGFAMYLAATLKSIVQNYESTKMKLTIDGEVVERELFMLTVANGARVGGGFIVAPRARNDDGVLDCLMVDPVSRATILALLPTVMVGKHERFSFVSMKPFRTLEFEAEKAVPVHLDGELWAPYEADVRSVRVEVEAGGIELLR